MSRADLMRAALASQQDRQERSKSDTIAYKAVQELYKITGWKKSTLLNEIRTIEGEPIIDALVALTDSDFFAKLGISPISLSKSELVSVKSPKRKDLINYYIEQTSLGKDKVIFSGGNAGLFIIHADTFALNPRYDFVRYAYPVPTADGDTAMIFIQSVRHYAIENDIREEE